MSSNFLQQFMAGWQMGQQRLDSQRANQMMQMRQEQEAYQRQQDEIQNQLRMDEAKLRKQQADMEFKAIKLDMAKQQAAMTPQYQQVAPGAVEDLGGGGPNDLVGKIALGPAMRENAPIMAEGFDGQKIRIPFMEEQQQMAQDEALASGKMMRLPDDPSVPEAFRGQMVPNNAATAALLQKWIDGPKLERIDTGDAIRFVDPRSIRAGDAFQKRPGPRQPAAPTVTGISNDRQQRLLRILPEAGNWREITDATPVIDNETTRGGNRAALSEWAADTGVILPDKKSKAMAIAAKADLADIDELKKYLNDPEVLRDLGAWRGRMANFLSEGWAGNGKVSKKTLAFRANLNQLAAKKRHEIYGAAVTGAEVGFARGFIPALDQSPDAMWANIQEFEDQINRGMAARFGGGGGAVSKDDPLGLLGGQ